MGLSENELNLIQSFFKDKPVKKVYVFGSQARGDNSPESDIDLYLELEKVKGFGLEFYSWFDSLKELLRKKVDIVTPNSAHPNIKPFIEKDKKLIYER